MGKDDDFNEPYLPERYKQKVREKQQRRRIRKVLTVAAIVAVIAAVFILVSGFFSATPSDVPPAALPAPSPSAVPTTTTAVTAPSTTATIPSPVAAPAAETTATTPLPLAIPTTQAGSSSPAGFSIGPGVPRETSGGSLSLEGAVAALREYYPEEDYAIRSVNYSAGMSRNLFGFTMQPKAQSDGTASGVVVFIDAGSGMPYATGQESATVSETKVKNIVTSAFPDAGGSQVKAWYEKNPVKGDIWMFRYLSGNITAVVGSIDAASGEVLAFTRNIPASGRQTNPAIPLEKASSIANNYVSHQNGGDSPLNQTYAGYEPWGSASDPAAGQYLFRWERLSSGHPVDTDGFSVAVDAVTGSVIGYDKTWTTREYAFSKIPEQPVVQRDATFAVMEEAKKRYPASVESIRILSAEMRWNNRHNAGTAQLPDSVPLAWKVVFDDDTIRTGHDLSPAVAWVDLRTGTVTEMEYRH